MKALAAILLLLSLDAGATAKPTPVKLLTRELVHADRNGEGAATRERLYFQAQQSPFNAGARCQLKPILFNRTRLAQLCR